MVTVYIPHSPVPPAPALAFPYLSAAILNLKSSSGFTGPHCNMPPADQSTTSVFKALGSYADRIRENGGDSPKVAGTSKTIGASSPQPPAPAAAASGPSGSASASRLKMASASTSEKAAEQPEDDGPWETVQSARARTKQDKEREREQDKGSNSRNWRDRPQKEKGGSSSKDAVNDATPRGDTKKAAATGTPAAGSAGTSGSTKTKRAASSAPTTRNGSESGKSPAPTPAASASTSKPSTSAVGAPVKSAWSTPMTSQRATGASTPADTSAPQLAKAPQDATRSHTAPSSPSLNGTTVANSSIGDVSVASPNLSSDTYASSTPPTSAATKEVEDEGKSWRSRTTTKSSDQSQDKPSAATAPVAVAPKPAPPPTVNAWTARQQKASTSISAGTTPAINGALAGPTPASAANESSSKATTSVSAPVTATRLQFGDVTPTIDTSSKSTSNGHPEEPVKIGGKKKKKDAASVVGGQALVMDASQWPDVATAQAATVESTRADTKKEIKQTEEQAEEAAVTKKPKWTPIPASELLAAADEAAAAADANKRQTRKRGSKHGETSTSPATRTGGLPSKPKKGDGSKRSEIRLPPNPNGQAAKGSFKPTFGSVEPGSEVAAVDESVVSEHNGGEAIANGTTSVPLSRQTSKSGQPQSPTRSLTDPSVPLEQAIRLGSGPLKSHPMHQNATAPLPQQPFPASAGGNLPRPPRAGRSSFSGRGGRGGHRGGRGGFDPTYAAGGNLYAQGYGMGYNPAAAGWNYGQAAGQQPMFDPMQAQWFNMQMYGRGPMPPPPTPQTVIAGPLEPLRFYVLGQIEYYFSMQNLAMDFFLRQQMDTEGWISIAMIASFNRIRSLTPEVPIVKEMMEQSSLLEVQGDHVRLRGEDAKKWVLPDAKTSPFPADATPNAEGSATSTPDASSAIAATPETLKLESASQAESVSGLPDDLEVDLGFPGVSEYPAYKHQPGDVANALMKSSSAAAASAPVAPSSTAASDLNETTPGTSVVSEDKAER